MSKYHSRPGPIGALLDEYARAADHVSDLVLPLSDAEFHFSVDADGPDPDTRSIATILYHLVRSGYGYAKYCRQLTAGGSSASGSAGDSDAGAPPSEPPADPQDAILQLRRMIDESARALPLDGSIDEASVIKNSIVAGWGQTYDLEQILEHAIVHLLRHRRQIEKYLRQIHEARP